MLLHSTAMTSRQNSEDAGNTPGFQFLEDDANDIRFLFGLLKEIIEVDAGEAWAQRYRADDLEERNARLEHQLKESVPVSDWDNPPPEVRTGLDVAAAQERALLNDRLELLRNRIRYLEGRLREEQSRNWYLEWLCRDLQEKLFRHGVESDSEESGVDDDVENEHAPSEASGDETVETGGVGIGRRDT
ncbi:hypothetical protein QBC38DRAFT_487685 [Podospora fimiseda]|uniref:Uncharacterized protein n=1 Tax=Podospora fimiseda TaxID=252190 RepID=A0AAN7GSE3_9PEZI|nr:hypothetical protein QBC38DRAFT_487685 [Podospora fimiseda]